MLDRKLTVCQLMQLNEGSANVHGYLQWYRKYHNYYRLLVKQLKFIFIIDEMHKQYLLTVVFIYQPQSLQWLIFLTMDIHWRSKVEGSAYWGEIKISGWYQVQASVYGWLGVVTAKSTSHDDLCVPVLQIIYLDVIQENKTNDSRSAAD